MKKYYILVCFLFCFSDISNAGILVPWSPVSLNVGLDYQIPKVSDYSSSGDSMFNDIKKFQNTNIYVGARAFKYFGAEAGFSKINKNFSDDSSIGSGTTINQQYVMGKLYVPIINLIAFSLDGYVGLGMSMLDISTTTTVTGLNGATSRIEESSDITNSLRYDVGLESSLLGIVSARVGWYTLQKKIDVLDDGRFSAIYAGLSVYLL